MADEKRLHELLDVYEQAKQEGDDATAQAVMAAYRRESAGATHAGQVRPNPIKSLIGMGDIALQMGTKGAEQAVAGLAGIGTPFMNLVGLTDKSPTDVVEAVSNAIPDYTVKSEYGKLIQQGLQKPMEGLANLKDSLGESGLQAPVSPLSLMQAARTGALPEESPLRATAAYMAPDAALALVGARTGAKPTPVVPKVINAPKPTSVAGEIADLFRKGGPERILTRYQREKIGSPELQEQVVNALEGPAATEFVPGSKPTAAEVLSQNAAGSPIVAHQGIVAKTPGGPSAAFGERLGEQAKAQAAASTKVKDELGPVREWLLDQANQAGFPGAKPRVQVVDGRPVTVNVGSAPVPGMRNDVVLKALDDMATKPGIATVTAKAAKAIRQKVLDKTKADPRTAKDDTGGRGLIDANDLYTIRKEVGIDIKNMSKESGNWDKKTTAGAEREIQLAIDDAIEAVAPGWKADYMAKYAEGMKPIGLDKARAKAAKKPPQRTNVSGPPIGQAAKPEAPNLLSRTAMFANFLMKQRARRIHNEIEALAADRYLHPQKLADALRGTPPKKATPPSRISGKTTAIPSEAERRRRLAEALRK